MIRKIKRRIRRIFWGFVYKYSTDETLRNVIVFESAPDLSDNAKAVFDEMIRRGLNRTYKLVYDLYDTDEMIDFKDNNVYGIPCWDPQAEYYKKKAKVKVFCNRLWKKENEKQFCIYLSHGTGIKDVRRYYNLPSSIDYCVAQSPQVVESHAYALNFDVNKTVPLGFPRNDILTTKDKIEIRNILNTECEKVIVWYPTFRKHHNGFSTASKNALPIIHNGDYAKKLNDCARKNNVLIVLKPHFAQDVSYIKDLNLSNIRFIGDDFFEKHNITSYQFVGATDALVTDYSSIYFDYTLCDKPVAVIWEDIEEYKQNPGLVENYEYLLKGAEKVYTLDDFIDFLERVANGVDLLKKEREDIRDYVNVSTDGKSAERVVDFIIEKAGLI